MKKLLLLRHAKSDWSAGALADHDRPLNARGQEAARVMGAFLRRTGQVPAMVISSSAVRARTTLELAMQAGRWSTDVRITDELYDASPEQVLEEVRKVPDGSDAVLLVGHEPTWSQLVARLCQGGLVRFPTAAMARIDLSAASWREAHYGRGELVWFVPPKLFTKGDFEFCA